MQQKDTGRRLDPKYGTLVVPEGGLFTTSMVAKVCGCDPQLVRKWARPYRMGQRMARDFFFSDEYQNSHKVSEGSRTSVYNIEYWMDLIVDMMPE